MDAEVALSCVAHGRLVSRSVPLSSVFKVGLRFVRLDFGSSESEELAEVRRARAVRAGGEAVAAADALVVVDLHDPVRTLVSRLDGTDGYAGRVVALHAGAGSEAPRDVGIFAELLVQHRSINDARRKLIFRDAGDGAGRTADALAEIDHHRPSPLLNRLFERAAEFSLHAQQEIFTFRKLRQSFFGFFCFRAFGFSREPARDGCSRQNRLQKVPSRAGIFLSISAFHDRLLISPYLKTEIQALTNQVERLLPSNPASASRILRKAVVSNSYAATVAIRDTNGLGIMAYAANRRANVSA